MHNPQLVNQISVSGGREWRGDCPFCNKPEHFYMNKRSGLWDCKSCGESGNWNKFLKVKKEGIIKLTKKKIRKDRKLKIKKLKTIDLKENLKIEDEEDIEEIKMPNSFIPINEEDTPNAYQYIVSRNYNQHIIDKYDLRVSTGSFFFNRIIIPVYMYKKLYAYLGRWMDIDGAEKIKRKYKNSYGSKFSKMIGNYDLINRREVVILCEGSFSSYRIDYNSGYTFGKKLSNEQVQLLKEKRIKKVLLFFDSDGQKEIIKSSNLLLENNIEVLVYLLDEGDPDDLNNDDGKLYERLLSDAEKYIPKTFVPKFVRRTNLNIKEKDFYSLKKINLISL